MKVGLRQFSNQSIESFKQAVGSGELTRSGLARKLCELTDWRNKKGDICLAQARKALPELARQLSITLPAHHGKIPQVSTYDRYEAIPSLDCSLEQLGEISVKLVSKNETRSWHSMMHSWHPRDVPKLPGQALKYWVVSEHHGRLGGLSFHGGSWHEKARDDFIGWSPRARAENLCLVVNNARFLILPQVHIHGLASAALKLAQECLLADWERVYGVTPALAYTHVDKAHSGQSYRASGWHYAGMTTGRRCEKEEPKQVFVLPFQAQWQHRLQEFSTERFRAALFPAVPDEADWTELEYGGSTYPEGRIAKRLLSMGKAWDKARGDETPRIFNTTASQKAAYRLFNNEQVTMDDFFESHRQSTVQRCAQHPVVLSVQDTTTLNFDSLKGVNKDLCSIGGTAKGICAHVTMAFSPDGSRVLGVLDIDGDFRPRAKADAKQGSDKDAKQVAKDQHCKESLRWIEGMELTAELSAAVAATHTLQAEADSEEPVAGSLAMPLTRMVSVCDREGDIWDLFQRQHELADQVGLLVRSNSARQRKVVLEDGRTVSLQEHLASLEPITSKTVSIDAQGGKRARDKRLVPVSLRIAKVHLKAPATKSKNHDQASLPVIAVLIKEDHPPTDTQSPLNWLLLCTEGEADAENALRIGQWYEARWGIEEFFRVLKSGCKIHNRQFQQTQALLKSMVFDAITSWRVFDLQRRAKVEPNTPANEVVEPEELETCQLLIQDMYPQLPARPPPDLTIREYVINVGKLAGFRPTKKQPIPGTKLLWAGTTKLMNAMIGIRIYKTAQENLRDRGGG